MSRKKCFYALLLFAIGAVLPFVFTGCSRSEEPTVTKPGDQYYTGPMQPKSKSNKMDGGVTR